MTTSEQAAREAVERGRFGRAQVPRDGKLVSAFSLLLDAYRTAIEQRVGREAADLMRRNGCADHAWIVEHIGKEKADADA